MRLLDKAYAEYKKSVEQLTSIKAGEMTFRETGMNVSFESWIAPHLAASAYELLDEKEAENYVEMKLSRPGDGPGKWVTVLVQRCNGLTPGEKAAKAIKERDEWKSLAVYRMQKIEELDEMVAESDTRVAELETRNTKLRAFVAELEAEIDLLRERLSDNPRISQP